MHVAIEEAKDAPGCYDMPVSCDNETHKLRFHSSENRVSAPNHPEVPVEAYAAMQELGGTPPNCLQLVILINSLGVDRFLKLAEVVVDMRKGNSEDTSWKQVASAIDLIRGKK